MPNFSEITVHFVEKNPSMFTFMFLFFTHEKSKALMFLTYKIKGFDVLCSYFFELQSLYVLIWPCSYKKKSVYRKSVYHKLLDRRVYLHVFSCWIPIWPTVSVPLSLGLSCFSLLNLKFWQEYIWPNFVGVIFCIP